MFLWFLPIMIGRPPRTKTYKRRPTRKDKVQVFSFFKMVFLVILLGFTFIFIYVWLNLALVRKGYLLSAGEAKREYLDKRNKELKLEVGKLKSLDRIEKIAREKIKLSDPKKHEVIWINR